MKVFTNTFDLAKASPHRFWVAPYSDFKIGIKILAKGEVVDKDFTVKAGAVELTPDEDKIDGFTLYTLKSGDSGFVEYTIEVEDIAEKLKLTQIVTDSTVFEIDAGGGGDVPADVATQTWVNSQISDFVEEDALTAYVPLTGNVNMTGSLSVANDSNGVYLDSSNGVTVWDVDEGKRKEISLDYDGLFVKGYNDTAAKEIEYPTKSGTMLVDADLTAYYTKSETSSATEINTALAGKQPTGDYALTSQIPTVNNASVTLTQDGTTVGSFTLNQSNDISVDFAGGSSGGGITPEDAIYNNINIPETVCLKTDGSISSYNLTSFADLTATIGRDNAKIVVGTQISSLDGFPMYNSHLKEYILPNTLKDLKNYAFQLNVGEWPLKYVRIPDSVVSCKNLAFHNTDLPIVDFGNMRTTVLSTDYNYAIAAKSTVQFYVPDALYDTWIAASNWSGKASQIHRHSELEAPYLYSSKVSGGAATGTTGTPAAVNAVKSVYETDWQTLSASADANTFYVVVSDPA